MPIMKLDDIVTTTLRFLVYGPPGAGKTYLMGSALDVPEMCPILWFECDSGLLSIKNRLQEHWDRIKILKLETRQDIEMIRSVVQARPAKAKTLVIDSLTELHALVLSARLETQGRGGQTPQIQDYGSVSSFILDTLRALTRRDDMNLLVVCGERYQTDESTGALHIVPDATGQLCQRIPRYFHIVGYLTADVKSDSKGNVKTLSHVMRVQPYGRVYAKDRTPDSPFGTAVADPTIEMLYKGINGLLPEQLDSRGVAEKEQE